MTENETIYEAFLKPATVQVEGHELKVLVAHAHMEIADEHLDIVIPAELVEARWKVEDGEDTLLRDMPLSITSLDGPTSIISLSARDKNGSRKLWTTADDLHIWVVELAKFGYTVDKMLTDEQASALQEVGS